MNFLVVVSSSEHGNMNGLGRDVSRNVALHARQAGTFFQVALLFSEMNDLK